MPRVINNGLPVEPLFEADYFFPAHHNLNIGIFSHYNLYSTIEPVRNATYRADIHYLLTRSTKELRRIQLSVNIIKRHFDGVLLLVFHKQARYSGLGGDITYFRNGNCYISVTVSDKKPLPVCLGFILQKPVNLCNFSCS